MSVLACRQAAWAGFTAPCQHVRSKGGCRDCANRMQGMSLAACGLLDCKAAGRRCWPAALHKAFDPSMQAMALARAAGSSLPLAVAGMPMQMRALCESWTHLDGGLCGQPRLLYCAG